MSRKSMRGGNGCNTPRKSKRSMRGGYSVNSGVGYAKAMLHPK